RTAGAHAVAAGGGAGPPGAVALADADDREARGARRRRRRRAIMSEGGGHRSMIRLIIAFAALVGLAGEAAAQQYPTRPVEIVVPFVPGGGAALIARATADYLGKKWGQPLLVVNKPGGGGVIGARAALKEGRADGYTVLMDVHTTAPMMIGAWKTPPLTLAD